MNLAADRDLRLAKEVMLTELHVSNFKSLGDVTLPLSDELTLLVGTNASGKSNALEALELLSWLARGRRLGELPVAMREGQLSLRGKVEDLTGRRPAADLHPAHYPDALSLRQHETFGGRERACEAALLSDGTLRVLAVAAALLSVEERSLVVIEEIDNGVHPSRARSLLQNIREVARRRELRVLLTTHNPALLDALPEEAIPHVVTCFRDPQGLSRLLRLEDLRRYPQLVARGPLGYLAGSGVLERFLTESMEAPRAEQQSLDWLQDILGGEERAPGPPRPRTRMRTSALSAEATSR